MAHSVGVQNPLSRGASFCNYVNLELRLSLKYTRLFLNWPGVNQFRKFLSFVASPPWKTRAAVGYLTCCHARLSWEFLSETLVCHKLSRSFLNLTEQTCQFQGNNNFMSAYSRRQEILNAGHEIYSNDSAGLSRYNSISASALKRRFSQL